jgi:hypothetical protein
MKYCYLLYITILIVSCNIAYNSNGEILKRGKCKYGGTSQQQFLVNNSKNEIVTFTLKIKHEEKEKNSETGNFEINTIINTKTYTLNPGEEWELECEEFSMGTSRSTGIYGSYSSVLIDHKYYYEIVGEVVHK